MNRRDLLRGLVLAAIVACTKTDEAVDPVWGKEPCAHCRMLVGERRYAAQVVSDGDRKYFDDIGCMVSFLAEHKAERSWVRVDGRWADAKGARYAKGAKTPMDFGWEARAEGGVGWDEMRDDVIARRSER